MFVQFKKWGQLLGGALFLVVLVAGLRVGLSRTVDYGVAVDAQKKAMSWSAYLIENIPDIERLIASGTPSAEQIQSIRMAEHIGDVFRFKLFNADGDLVLVSDEVEKVGQSFVLGDHNGNAGLVLKTGRSLADLNDGTQKENRPDLYVEAYVPVKDATDNVVGVAEVYLDQTSISKLFHNLFYFVAIVIAAIVALAFAVPYVGYFLKTREERRSRNKAEYLARYDQVAKIFNRAGLMEAIDRRCHENQQFLQKSCLVLLDIDQFKAINDTYGHTNGDAFLNQVGNAISQNLGDDDVAGRIGGDEFMIVLNDVDASEASIVVEKIQAMVSTPLHNQGDTISGHCSLGIFDPSNENTTLEECMQKADIALYQAKIDGRNVFRIFDKDMEKHALRRRHVESAILSGLIEDRFEVHFQPLLHQKTKKCAGFEALLRLKDSDGVEISPVEFIPIAECMGEIVSVGAWVLETALTLISKGPSHLFVSVNLSGRQFDDNKLVPLVKELLEKTGVAASRLELEVTESLLMENPDSVSAQMDALREHGVSLAMDDFGTGYSSLGYLWKFGFDKLKIDRSFLAGLDYSSDKAREILETIVVLGHRLDMTVTAEGIENETQAQILSDLECDHFQGFLFGRPMPFEGIAPFLLGNVHPLKPNSANTKMMIEDKEQRDIG